MTRSTKETASHTSIVVTEIVRSMARHADQVATAVVGVGDADATLLLTVHPEDLQEVLGQEGRILRALRMVINDVGAKYTTSLQLQVETTRPSPGPPLPSTFEKQSFEGRAQRSGNPDER